MTDKEIVQALRCCADYSCSAKCPAFPAGLDCREEMHKEVLALLECLTAENAALEKQLGAASKESVLKKLEINEKLRELDELHRMVDGIPPEILQAVKQVAAHKPQER